MTIRELIQQLEEFDDENKDYTIGVIFRIQLTPDCRISGKIENIIVPENVDVSNKKVWLKARVGL